MSSQPRAAFWNVAPLVAAALLVLNGLYLDFSDATAHAVIAGAGILIWLPWRRVGGAILISWFSLVAIGAIVSDLFTFKHLAPVSLGESRSSVVNRLGPPASSFPSLHAARTTDFGYAVPSPYRFSDRSPTSVYLRDDYAIWVMYDDADRVEGVFVGGS